MLKKSFNDLGWKPELQRAILARGSIDECFPHVLTKKLIIPICTGNNVVFQSELVANVIEILAIPILQKIDHRPKQPIQSLILCQHQPTSRKIVNEIYEIGSDHMDDLVVFGMDKADDEYKLAMDHPQIMAVNANRAAFLLEKGMLKMEAIKMVIVFEIDEMLQDNKGPVLDHIFATLSKDVQMVFCTRDLTMSVLDFMRNHMTTPIVIERLDNLEEEHTFESSDPDEKDGGRRFFGGEELEDGGRGFVGGEELELGCREFGGFKRFRK